MLLSERITRLRTVTRGRPKLPFPATSRLRIVQVTANASFDAVECFPFECWKELESYQPQALAGPAVELQMIATRVQERTLDLSSVDHAVFVLTQWGRSALSDTSRVVLWQTFGVPVYELFMSAQGMLVACECEAHDGWHVQPNVKFAVADGEIFLLAPGESGPGKAGRLETGRCACGRAGLRIVCTEPQASLNGARQLAATA